MSTPITVGVIRDTLLLSNEQVESMCGAARVAVQVFAQYWTDANIIFVPPGGQVPAGAYQLWLKDTTDQAGAVGYHTDDGLPIAYVFVKDDIDNGMNWGVTFTHELWEMLADPDINKTVTAGETEYPIEVADCCEDDSLAWDVTGTDGVTHKVSAFALPSWFDPSGVAPFTYPDIPAITAPFMLAPGGYIGERVLPGGAWTQRFASEVRTARQVKSAGSRTMRRFRGGSPFASNATTAPRSFP